MVAVLVAVVVFFAALGLEFFSPVPDSETSLSTAARAWDGARCQEAPEAQMSPSRQISGDEIAVEALSDISFQPITRHASLLPTAICKAQSRAVATTEFLGERGIVPAIEGLLAAFPSDSPCRTSTRSIGIVIFDFFPPRYCRRVGGRMTPVARVIGQPPRRRRGGLPARAATT